MEKALDPRSLIKKNTGVIVAAIAVSAIYVPLMLYLRTLPVPEPGVLQPPFQHFGGNAWIARAIPGAMSDDSHHPDRSVLQLYENGQPLGPPHSLHANIAKLGHGRYSHWGASIVFSTSDDGDPNTNGRVYRAVDDQAIRTH